MTLRVAVQMDPIEKIKIAGDSTFALLLEAQRRGHALFYYTPDRLSLHSETVIADVQSLSVQDVEGAHAKLGESARVDLSTFDVVLLRQDPPFDIAYITTTYLLERLSPKTLVVNDPKAVRDAPEKLFVMNYAAFMPETLITRSRGEIEAFRRAHGDVVMKPLYGNGGAAVFHVAKNDANFGSLYDLFSTMFMEPWVVQRFIPEIVQGDKRIFLVDGEFAGALNRVPVAGDIRSNLARGGTGSLAELTAREQDICAVLGPALREMSILFAGIDVIGGYLTEINITSPTGLRAYLRMGGPDLAPKIWDAIEKKI